MVNGFPKNSLGWNPQLGSMKAFLMVVPLVALLALMIFYPIIKLGYDSVTQGNGFGNYSDAFSLGSNQRAFRTTFLSGIMITAIVMVIGGIIGWYLRSVKSFAVRTIIWTAVFVPFWMGSVVKTFAIVLLLGNNGLFNVVIQFFGFPPVRILYTQWAVIYGIVYSMIPFAVFTMFAVFRTIEEPLLQAAQGLGASRIGAIFEIALPLAFPGIVASAAVVFSLTIGYYITPIVLGGAQAPFVATIISQEIFQYFNFPAAATLSIILITCACGVVAVALVMVGPERFRKAVTR